MYSGNTYCPLQMNAADNILFAFFLCVDLLQMGTTIINLWYRNVREHGSTYTYSLSLELAFKNVPAISLYIQKCNQTPKKSKYIFMWTTIGIQKGARILAIQKH